MGVTEIRTTFSLRKRSWENDVPLIIVVLENNNPLHLAFCKTVMNLLPYRLQRNWERKIYTGTARSPVVVENEKQMFDYVRDNPGAIGYAKSDSVAAVQGVRSIYESD